MVDLTQITRFVLPLYIMNWIFGIGVIEYPLGNPHPIISVVYSAAWIITFCILAATSYSDITQHFSITSIEVPIKILYFSQILLTISTIALGWHRSEALHRVVVKTVLADNMMERIGIPKDYAQMLKAQIRRAICGLIFAISVIASNSGLVMLKNTSLHSRFLIAIVFAYPVLLIFIADFTFMHIVSCTRYRFTKLNECSKSMLTNTVEFPQHGRIIKLSGESAISNVYIMSSASKNPTVIIETAKQIHLQLVKVCQEADRTYGLQILLSIIVAFVVITGNMYMLYEILVDVQLPRKIMYSSFITAIIWITYYVMKISSISSICSSCVERSIKTGDIINELYDDPVIGSDTQSQIRDFNIQLIQKPLKFTAYGFINLDFTLIQGMIASITTYLMILIQLGKLPAINSFLK